MVITVKFVGAFRSTSGKSRFTLKLENMVLLREAVKKIVEELPQLKRVLIDPELEDPRPNTLILVNGKEISILNGLDTMLKDGDEVVFVPVVHGG
jgi:molybdopterin synthase sulfur carrier subunit